MGIERYNNGNENSLDRLEGTFQLVEERISKFEDKLIEMMQPEEQREKRMKKNEQSIRTVVIKCTNVYIKVSKGRRRKAESI